MLIIAPSRDFFFMPAPIARAAALRRARRFDSPRAGVTVHAAGSEARAAAR